MSVAAVPAKPTRALKPKPASRKSKVTAKDTGITDVKIRVPRPAATGPKSAVASPEISSEEDESSSAEEGSSDEEDEIMVIDRIEDVSTTNFITKHKDILAIYIYACGTVVDFCYSIVQ